MVDFEVLGEVTARHGDRQARLSPQQRHLLAALVMERGAPVRTGRLAEILWDFDERYHPGGGVKRIASGLRTELRVAASSDDDLVPSGYGGYSLSVTPTQADVHRFRAKAARARSAEGAERLEVMREALREWGPDAGGVHGGEPLRGLEGQWAESVRRKLRTEYRDAVVSCLRQGISDRDYDGVWRECEQRAADDVQALLDEELVAYWMFASFNAGRPDMAREVYRQAQDAAAQAGVRFSDSLRELDGKLRTDIPPAGAQVEAGALSLLPSSTDRQSADEEDPEEDPVAEKAEENRSLRIRSTTAVARVGAGGSVTGVRADLDGSRSVDIESDTRADEVFGAVTGVAIRQVRRS